MEGANLRPPGRGHRARQPDGFRVQVRRSPGRGCRDVDFRFRERIDYPCWAEDDGRPFPDPPANLEFFAEIPGFEIPRIHDPGHLLVGRRSKPWTFGIRQAHLEGSVPFAHNDLRINGVGSATGGLTIVLGGSNAIDRGVIRLGPAEVTWASRELTDDLALEVDVNVKPFSRSVHRAVDVMEGTSGTLTVAGTNSSGFAVNIDCPYHPAAGAGRALARVRNRRAGSSPREERAQECLRAVGSGRRRVILDARRSRCRVTWRCTLH